MTEDFAEGSIHLTDIIRSTGRRLTTDDLATVVENLILVPAHQLVD